MAAQHEGGHVFDRHLEFLGQELAEAGAVEHAGHADDLVGGQAGRLLSAQTIASSGLVMQMTNAFGAYFPMFAPTCFITLVLMPIRSSRLMPGLRGTPAVTIRHPRPRSPNSRCRRS